jgi:PAS domain S-box-containing protein
MWSSNVRLEIVTWNAAATRLFGWEAAEIVGQPLATIIPPERYYELHEMHGRVLGGGAVDDEPVSRLHKDGRLLDLRISVRPILEDGVFVGMATIARRSGG